MEETDDNFGREFEEVSAQFAKLAKLAASSGGLKTPQARELLGEIQALNDSTKALLAARWVTQGDFDALTARTRGMMKKLLGTIPYRGAPQ